jgi:hypothetical protein
MDGDEINVCRAGPIFSGDIESREDFHFAFLTQNKEQRGVSPRQSR